MQTDTGIRRRGDGSIDTDYYLARASSARSRQAYHLLGMDRR